MVKISKGSKRQELARKYNIQRIVSAHKKKAKKLARKGEKPTNRRKQPQIPNCIFKEEVLENLKRTKAITESHNMESRVKRKAQSRQPNQNKQGSSA